MLTNWHLWRWCVSCMHSTYMSFLTVLGSHGKALHVLIDSDNNRSLGLPRLDERTKPDTTQLDTRYFKRVGHHLNALPRKRLTSALIKGETLKKRGAKNGHFAQNGRLSPGTYSIGSKALPWTTDRTDNKQMHQCTPGLINTPHTSN